MLFRDNPEVINMWNNRNKIELPHKGWLIYYIDNNAGFIEDGVYATEESRDKKLEWWRTHFAQPWTYKEVEIKQ